jgi:hypothetical protein
LVLPAAQVLPNWPGIREQHSKVFCLFFSKKKYFLAKRENSPHSHNALFRSG